MSYFVTTSNNIARTQQQPRDAWDLICQREIALDYADYTLLLSFIIIKMYIQAKNSDDDNDHCTIIISTDNSQ